MFLLYTCKPYFILASGQPFATADIVPKLETCAKFLKHADNTPKVMLQVKRLLGFEALSSELARVYEDYVADATQPRKPLMPGDFHGAVEKC